MSPADFGLLQPDLEPVTLALRHVLERPDRRVDAVYFPESGFASVVAVQADDTKVEVGLIGREGMSGLTIVLGNHRSPHSTYMQSPGRGQRIGAAKFRTAIQTERVPALPAAEIRAGLHGPDRAHRHLECARQDRARLARWILMAHDRLDGDSLPLTHEFLSLMLGVRRAGVTEALHALATEKLIRSARSEIVVLNRKGLERRAGDSYGVPEAELRRLLG